MPVILECRISGNHPGVDRTPIRKSPTGGFRCLSRLRPVNLRLVERQLYRRAQFSRVAASNRRGSSVIIQ
jgi:hypothetical protein